MGLDAFHVPLVDHCHDVFVVFEVVELVEDAEVALVDEDLFLFGGDLVQHGHQEVYAAAVH